MRTASALISDFITYLEELNIVYGKNYDTTSSNISIFMYSDEFKDYVSSKLSQDASIFSKSISEILSMDIIDGKLVENDEGESLKDILDEDENNLEEIIPEEGEESEEDTLDKTNQAQNEQMQESSEEEQNDIFDILNNIFSDEKIIEYADLDQNGSLSQEEIGIFLKMIASNDSNEEDISLEDIILALEEIKGPKNQTDEIIASPEENVSQENETKETSHTSSGGSSGSSHSGTSSSSYSSNSSVSDVKEKTLDNMTLDELKEEYSKAQSQKEAKEDNYNQTKTDGQSAIEEAKGKEDEAYKNYLEATEENEEQDENFSGQIDDLNTKITDKEDQIRQRKTDISDKKIELSQAEHEYEAANNTYNSLNSALEELKSTDTSDMDDSQKADLESKISQLTAQRDEALDAKNLAETKKEQIQNDLDTLTTGLSELEGELEEFQNQMTALEEELLKAHPEIEEMLKAYQQAKESRNETENKVEIAIKKAQSDLVSAQEALNKVDSAIQNYNTKEIIKENSIDPKNLYNEEAGALLAQKALNVPGTTGYCLAGVHQSLVRTYGTGVPGLGSAYKAAEVLRGNVAGYEEIASHFVEVQVKREELANLPKGAIVVWDNNATSGGSNVSELGRIHGHISISLGNGKESSDHIANQIVNRDAEFSVFYPIS